GSLGGAAVPGGGGAGAAVRGGGLRLRCRGAGGRRCCYGGVPGVVLRWACRGTRPGCEGLALGRAVHAVRSVGAAPTVQRWRGAALLLRGCAGRGAALGL